MEATDCELDTLDREILKKLQADSRKTFIEIARELSVSGGTVHARVGRMKDAGIISGSRICIDYQKLGYSIQSFIGIKLVKAHDASSLMPRLESINEVLEVHYTTGAYSLFIKVMVPSMKDLHSLLFDRLQSFDEIQSTETLIILNTSLDRDMPL